MKSQRGFKILQWIKLQLKDFSPQHIPSIKYEGTSQSQCGFLFCILNKMKLLPSQGKARLAPGKQHGISLKSHKYFKHSQCIGHFTLYNENWS